MATLAQSPRPSPFAPDPRGCTTGPTKTLPILSSAAPLPSIAVVADDMDISQPLVGAMGPPSQHSPVSNGDRPLEHHTPSPSDAHTTNGSQGHPISAAAAAQQPKVVQTAFIHKLYNMLEDQHIQHLISWSNTNESFVMSPSSEFSKVLAQYFKHTNISSFVRQLNMYGFHKVSDVFQTGAPDSPLWEFKHGAGNFKRGDLVGLREIKRRASRHALIHRDSFSTITPKPPLPPQSGLQLEAMADPVEARLNMLEWWTQELHARLLRTEDAYTAMTSRGQILLDGLSRCHHWNQELSSHLLTLVPDPDNPIHRDVSAMRHDIQRQAESLRSLEDSPEPLFGSKTSFFQNSSTESGLAVSPRQRLFDEARRPSLQGLRSTARPNPIRALVPPHLQVSPRNYNATGSSFSPTSSRTTYQHALPPPPLPPPPPTHQAAQSPHPLSHMTSPSANLSRRHTSADIRVQGWQGGPPPLPNYVRGGSPYASGQSSSAWPSSPRASANAGDQQIRDALAQYELPQVSHASSRQHSPPPPLEGGIPTFANGFGSSYANSNDIGWQLPGPRYPFKGLETPGPLTRRSSMASNVHSLLNPADTAEREGEDDGPDERKRKRVL